MLPVLFLSPTRRKQLAVCSLITFSAAFAWAQPQPRVVESRAAPAPTHQLYVGLELFVPDAGEMKTVRQVSGNHALVTNEAGQIEELERTTGFRWKLVPKISDSVAEISGLDFEPTYSPRNDPYRKWAGRQTNIMNYQQDQLNQAEYIAGNLSQPASVPTPDVNGVNVAVADEQSMRQHTIKQFESIVGDAAMVDDMMDPEYARREIENREAGQGLDAVRLRFNVSSPTPMADAYYVALMRVRDPKGGIHDINFYKPIGSLGSSPKKINHLQTGVPPDSEILEVKIHLFNRGKEVATNRSEKSFGLSAAEAHQYLLLDHTANNRGETLPAQPVWELAPVALKSAPSPAPFDYNVSVTVDAEGSPVLRDDTNQIIPDQVAAVVRDLTFLPALQEGQPVESTVVINLADYFR